MLYATLSKTSAVKLKNYVRIVVIALLIYSFIPITNARVFFNQNLTRAANIASRNESINVQLVFGGFEEKLINETQLLNYLPNDYTRALKLSYPATTYSYNYSLSFLSDSAFQSLKGYISSIAITGKDIGYRVNNTLLKQYMLDGTTEFVFSIDGMKIDARAVESFIATNILDSKQTGPTYTLYLLNFSCFDSADHKTEHFYYINGTSVNEGEMYWRIGAEKYVTDGPTVGWGGNYRFAYVDLSATSAYLSGYPAIRMHLMFDLLYQKYDLDAFTQVYDVYSQTGNKFLQLYIAQWINAFLDTLIPGKLVCEPPVGQSYSIPIMIYNNLTPAELYSNEKLSWLINTSQVQSMFQYAFPWAEWNCYINWYRLEDSPLMKNLIAQYLELGEFPGDQGSGYFIDITKGFHQFLSENFSLFVPESQQHGVVLPCFVFLSDEVTFFYHTWGLGGIGLNIVIAAGRSSSILFGLSLTELLVHEVGHLLGLAHPHNENVGFGACFIEDPMSYFSNWVAKRFSTFSSDNLGRLHYDLYYYTAQEQYLNITQDYQSYGSPKSLKHLLKDIELHINQSYDFYLSANYSDAILTITKAISLMNSFSTKLNLLYTLKQPYVIIPVVFFGVAILGTGGYFRLKRLRKK
ncbi:MAG: hypothetical protein ACTSYD_02000 [Candidatus Heimdallarchaeaceae archaeon]